MKKEYLVNNKHKSNRKQALATLEKHIPTMNESTNIN